MTRLPFCGRWLCSLAPDQTWRNEANRASDVHPQGEEGNVTQGREAWVVVDGAIQVPSRPQSFQGRIWPFSREVAPARS
jgi:hypothetical protein